MLDKKILNFTHRIKGVVVTIQKLKIWVITDPTLGTTVQQLSRAHPKKRTNKSEDHILLMDTPMM